MLKCIGVLGVDVRCVEVSDKFGNCCVKRYRVFVFTCLGMSSFAVEVLRLLWQPAVQNRGRSKHR